MALGNIVRGRRDVGRGGFRGGFRGGRGMVRGGPGLGGNFHGGRGVGGNYRGPGAAVMPSRRPVGMLDTRLSSYKIAKSFKRLKENNAWRTDLYEKSGAEEGKLFVSNLDYGVSNQDIKELFSEIGELKRFGVHYDSHGRANGTAEVVFVRRAEAIAAMKRYNNVQLDGKPMKIELIGSNLNLNPARPVTARVNVVNSMDGRPKRTVVMMPQIRGRGSGPSRITSGFGRGRGGFQQYRMNSTNFGTNFGRGGGRDGTRGRGRDAGRGRGREVWRRVDKSADQLDKELDSYHAKAMDTS